MSLAALLILVAAAPAEAAKRTSCAARGSKTVLDDSRARVFKKGASHYGCLYRTGQRHWLPNYDDYLSRFRLASPFVAYMEWGDPSGSAVSDDLVLVDLRTGRWRNVAEFGSYLGASDRIKDLRLTRRGVVVWIALRQRESIPTQYSVEAWHAGVSSTLDPGPSVEPGSLAVTSSGDRVYWTNAGEPRSAPLR